MKAEKVVHVYALVQDDSGQEFRVHQSGNVYIWVNGDLHGFWQPYDEYESDYEKIKQTGQEVLK